MKSLEKTDRSVKEFPGIVDGLADNGSLRFSVGKNGKAQKPSEPTKRTKEAKKSEQFQLLIFGDSNAKKISPSAIATCDEIQSINYSIGGSKKRDLYEQLQAFKKDHDDASVKSIIIQVGTNHLPRVQTNDPYK